MSAAHAPGPWQVDHDDRPGMEWNTHIVSAPRPHLTVCFMAHGGKNDNSEGEANAKLIAAAPELLEALRLVTSQHQSGLPIPENQWNIARAAIAKATA